MPQFLDTTDPGVRTPLRRAAGGQARGQPGCGRGRRRYHRRCPGPGRRGAVIALTERFDRLALTPDTLRLTEAEIERPLRGRPGR